jgi:hypothetical protein
MARIDSLDDIMKNDDIARLNPGLVAQPQPKTSKYHNKRTESNCTVYASGREAKRAGELALLKRCGEVFCYFEQVPFKLAGGITYVADFVICWKDGRYTVEDAKGMKTKEYIQKKKLFEERYAPIKITEV